MKSTKMGIRLLLAEEKKVLGCYIRESEEFYFGAVEDKDLHKLEEELEIELDWL